MIHLREKNSAKTDFGTPKQVVEQDPKNGFKKHLGKGFMIQQKGHIVAKIQESSKYMLRLLPL